MARRKRHDERAAVGAVESIAAPASLDRLRRDVWAAWREVEPSAFETLRDEVLPSYRACVERGRRGRPRSWRTLCQSARLDLSPEDVCLHAALLAWLKRYPLSGASWAGDLALDTLEHWSPPPPKSRAPRGLLKVLGVKVEDERGHRRLAADRARRDREALEVPLSVSFELDSPGPPPLIAKLAPAEPAVQRWKDYRESAMAEAAAQIRAHWDARTRALRERGRFGAPAIRFVRPGHIRWLVQRKALRLSWGKIRAASEDNPSIGAIREGVKRLAKVLGLS
jgi:hypothetical protein